MQPSSRLKETYLRQCCTSETLPLYLYLDPRSWQCGPFKPPNIYWALSGRGTESGILEMKKQTNKQSLFRSENLESGNLDRAPLGHRALCVNVIKLLSRPVHSVGLICVMSRLQIEGHKWDTLGCSSIIVRFSLS